MPRCVLQIDLPGCAVSNPRTRRVAAAFEMELAVRPRSTRQLGGTGRLPASVATGRQAARATQKHPAPPPSRLEILCPTEIAVEPGQIAYLIGPSGSGKTQVLRVMRRSWPGPVVAGCLGESGDASGRAVLDLFGEPTDSALRLLCLAGLAEPRLWFAPARCLSAGQADRLALALLFGKVESACTGSQLARPVLLLIDEFGSRLDRLTAAVLATNLRRWLARQRGVAIVVATAHDDLVEPLAADWVWIKTAEGSLRVLRGAECGKETANTKGHEEARRNTKGMQER